MVTVGLWCCFVCQLKEGVQEKAQTHTPAFRNPQGLNENCFFLAQD